MLYIEIPYIDRKKNVKLKNSIKNILKSHGLCPLCLKILIDEKEGYIGTDIKIQVDDFFYHITICNNCANKINKTNKINGKNIKNYLDMIEIEINKIFMEIK